MVDPETVRLKLREIDRRLERLRRIATEGRDRFLEEADLRALAERHLQVGIQAALDIAIHIVAEDSAETPSSYGSAFETLAVLGVVDGGLGLRLRDAAGLRNILVHAYLEVDPERLWDRLAELGDLEHFSRAVERYLENHPA